MINIPFIKKFSPLALVALLPFAGNAREVARFDMDAASGRVTETVSGAKFAVSGQRPAEAVDGAVGRALRLDGYSTYVDANVGAIIPAGSKQMTASVWLAVETYPIVEIDVPTTEQVAIASCINESAKTGFGFFLGLDGKYSFKTYVGGWPLELKADGPMPQYQWVCLAAVIDTDARTATLYANGEPVATAKANGTLSVPASDMRIGRSFTERFSGPFCLTSFNGLIDDVAVWDEALAPQTIAAWAPEAEADLSVPASRFASDPMRPAFHGMPGANWTNESHGMTYSDGRFHIFFQKNANGPFMSRLHWGHLSSPNLYDWTEERIALTPGESYDIKGCWSGCVFSDAEITAGRPGIIYTGVDYAKAVIAQAEPVADDLAEWRKSQSPIINGRPAGLSDDFRDPYFFRSPAGAYIIVGSSKGGVGTTTLHAYNPASGSWSNTGATFFTGTDAASCGTFWEMPTVTPMGGDKWLFTATPLGTARGVATLYWTGTIAADGTFRPDKTAPYTVELPALARDGYGLLSPTIYQHQGKTIALGIVPDKLPSQANYELGYAHAYSLPREWSLATDGSLIQRPYSGLEAMRIPDGFARADVALNGTLALDGISGRAVELCGEFTVDAAQCGFTLLDDGASALKVYYDGATGEVVIDCSALDRLVNDASTFAGVYRSALPKPLAKGDVLKLNVFFDHSVLDVFVNDTYATSVRVFAKGKSTERATAFSSAPMQARSLRGWMLDASAGNSGIADIVTDADEAMIAVSDGVINYSAVAVPAIISVYDLAGAKKAERYLEASEGSVDTTMRGPHIITLRTLAGVTTKKAIF